jgi:hypothetical protein
MSINLKYEAMQQPLKMEPRSQMQYQMAALVEAIISFGSVDN